MGEGVGWALGRWGDLGGPGSGRGSGGFRGVGGVAGPLVPIVPIDPFKGIPIVDPHLYGSTGSHFVCDHLSGLGLSCALLSAVLV